MLAPGMRWTSSSEVAASMGGSRGGSNGERLTGGVAAVVGGRTAGRRRADRAAGKCLRIALLGTRSPCAALFPASGRRGRRAGDVGGYIRLEVVGRRSWQPGRGPVVRPGRGATRGFVGHRWSFPHPSSGTVPRKEVPQPEARAGRSTGIQAAVTRRIPLIRVRERPARPWRSDGAVGRCGYRGGRRTGAGRPPAPPRHRAHGRPA